jgi:hypothetical protein
MQPVTLRLPFGCDSVKKLGPAFLDNLLSHSSIPTLIQRYLIAKARIVCVAGKSIGSNIFNYIKVVKGTDFSDL